MWFTASLFFRSHHTKPDVQGLWEERIVLLNAEDEGSASEQAAAIGESEQTNFAVTSEDRATWRFVCVERVQAIEAEVLKPGIEVFSRYLRDSEAKSFLQPFE